MITVSKREFHLPYQDLLPLMAEGEFAQLVQDIRERGVLVPILLDEGLNILDGHHRLRAVAQLEAEGTEVPLPMEIRPGLTEAEKRDLAYAVNLHRRHLTPEQRREVVLRLRTEERWSTTRIAEALGVGEATVRRDLEGCSTSSNGEVEQALEVEHRFHNGRVRPGWAVEDLQINYLAYAMLPEDGPGHAFLFDFLGLRKAWRDHGEHWKQRYPFKGTHPHKNNGYVTWNCFVPIAVLQAAVNDRRSRVVPIEQSVRHAQQGLLFSA